MAHPDNPARPNGESPIRVKTAGGWVPNQFRHEASKPKPTLDPVNNKVVSVEETQVSPNTKVRSTKIVDPELNKALNQDLKQRRIK